LGAEKLGLKSRKIAEQLGISRPAVSKWISKGREIGREEDWLDPFG
jgi:predicted transcriptional regulator